MMATAVQQFANGTFTPDGHIYKNAAGKEIPSVTQILENLGFIDLSEVSPQRLEHKRRIGDAVHYYVHLVLQGIEVDWDKVHDDAANYCWAFDKFLAESNFVPDLIEGKPATEIVGVHKHHGMEYGYTYDLRGKIGGFPVLIDIKNTYAIEPSWPYQLAAYELTLPKPENEPYWRRLALWLRKDSRYELLPNGRKKEDVGDRKHDSEVFTWCL